MDGSEIDVQQPGHGAVKSPGNCGVHKKIVADGDFHAVRYEDWHCGNPTCPYCWESWAHNTARECMERIRAGRQLFSLIGSNYQLCHITISAPIENTFMLTTKYGYDKAMMIFAWLASLYGISGYMICHPWRGKKDDEDDISLEISEDEQTDPEYWREGMHVHIIGFADPDVIKSTSGLFYSLYGHVIKVIAEKMKDEYAENCISYALSHCGIGVRHEDGHKNLRAIRPIGLIQTSTNHESIAKLRDIKESVPLICEKCGDELFYYDDLKFMNQFPVNCEEDPRDYVEPVRVTLHHGAYCRKDELEKWRSITENMTDAQFMTYALRQSDGNIAIAFDERNTVIPPNFNMSDGSISPNDKPMPWRPPETSGQSLISPPDPPMFRPRMTFAYAEDDSIGWGSDDDI